MLLVSWFANLYRGRTVPAVAAATTDTALTGNVAAGLLQSAHALAGQDPHEAERLRGAAQAWLSVIR